uniref:Protein of unassigned function n=2 Tax=Methylobacterium oryzae CBMB20 TaxID=693986 RepID=A0A088B3E9_9HYPH|nr:protein of unassigned function [Methylobacterium oryzae CBMB20]
MLRPIMDHMAALAEGREVGTDVVRGVMIPVGRGEDDAGVTNLAEDVGSRHEPDPASTTVTPPTGVR